MPTPPARRTLAHRAPPPLLSRHGDGGGAAHSDGVGPHGDGVVARLDDLLDGAAAIEFTLRFAFSNPDMDTTIVGTANPHHLQANLDALAKGPLPADVYAEACRRLDAAAQE